MAGTDIAGAAARIGAHLVGRERELRLTLAAVAAGRDIILEGIRVHTYRDVAPAVSRLFEAR